MQNSGVELVAKDGIESSLSATDPNQEVQAKKKKKDNFVKRLYRQNLSGYVPIPRPVFAISFFASAGAVLLALGVALYVTGLNVHEQVFRYDNNGTLPDGQKLEDLSNAQIQDLLFQREGQGFVYNVTMVIEEDMDSPVYVYYQLGNYYQNYRRYINSADFSQMHGNTRSASDLSVCDPIRYVYFNQTTQQRESNSDFANEGLINPCGLWAWSYFNDTYNIYSGDSEIQVSDSNLAWSWQRNKLFGNYPPQNFNGAKNLTSDELYNATRGGGAIDGNVNQDERFMVWMRPEAHYTFDKLWGVIDQPLAKGTELTIQITNRYNMYNFGGLKAIVLSENSWMGGKNLFLGILMVVVGVLYLLAAFVFLIGRIVHNRPLGDERYLSWNKVQGNKKFMEAFKNFVKH